MTTEQEPAENLVERAKEGDREAFDQLVNTFRERLRNSIERWSRFRLGPKVDADEILQETFVRAYGRLARFEWREDDSFFRWLCGIAKRALAQAAQDARRTGPSVTCDPVHGSGTSPSKDLRRHERFDRLEAALKGLSSEHRQAIRLCRIDGLTSSEAAKRMNRSPAAVRQLLVRALRELKGSFGDTESFHLPDKQVRFKEEDDGE